PLSSLSPKLCWNAIRPVACLASLSDRGITRADASLTETVCDHGTPGRGSCVLLRGRGVRPIYCRHATIPDHFSGATRPLVAALVARPRAPRLRRVTPLRWVV